MLKIFYVIAIVGLVLSLSANAAIRNEGRTGLSFLKIGVGARATGMGEAYTAVATDAFATYWNPAGLRGSRQANVVAAHNVWILDVTNEYAALHLPGKEHSLGLHFSAFNVGGIEVRTIPSAEPLEVTNATYLSMGLSYARSFANNIDAGITVKYLYEKIFVHSASGVAFDLGFRFQTPTPNFYLAGVVQNIGKMSRFENEATRLPVISRIGFAYDLPREVGPFHFLLAADLVKPLEENLRFHVGAEALFNQQIGLRIGYLEGYENRFLSLGIGIQKSIFHFDYSYSPFQEDFGNAQRFSIFLQL